MFVFTKEGIVVTQGDSAEDFGIMVYDESKKYPRDFTNKSVRLVVAKKPGSLPDLVLQGTVSSNQVLFSLTPEDTKELKGTYIFEIEIHNNDNSYVETLALNGEEYCTFTVIPEIAK